MDTAQVAAGVPGRGSVTWRYGSDPRALGAAGYALVLQVAHPTVAAGVREHSTFASDPWRRLLRTLDYVYAMVYASPETAVATGRWLRDMHRPIRGTRPDGTRYSALEPTAFAWVHATLLDAMVAGHRLFGSTLTTAQVERLYGEWLGLGRVIGVRDGDLPRDWSGFREYVDATIRDVLEDSDVVHDVIEVMRRPVSPPLRAVPAGLWSVAWAPAGRIQSLATVGLLPPVLRERFGLRWSPAEERTLRAVGRVSRSLTPLLPERLRVTGPLWVRARQRAIEARARNAA